MKGFKTMSRLRIGIDGRPLTQQLTGIGRYVFELCKVLDLEMQNVDFFVYSNSNINKPVISERWHYCVDNSFFGKNLKKVAWLKLICGFLVMRDKIDIFWGTSSFLPLIGKIPSLLTVYDMNYKIVPETMSVSHLWAFKLFFQSDVKRATTVTCISEGTAKRLEQITDRTTQAVIYPGVGEQFKPASSDEISKCLRKYGITSSYILAVATWEPRKNLELLIKTFLEMPNLNNDQKLVLVGGRGWKDQRLVDIIGAETEKILPLGFVPDQDLPMLYSGCDTFVFPSVYEGFGIPVAEAIACGSRVITSDIPELHEAGDEDTIYIQPNQNQLTKALTQPKKLQRQQSSIRKFSWTQEGLKLSQELLKLKG
jgi:glycosyltransferase involved in cell wall biosynthesis